MKKVNYIASSCKSTLLLQAQDISKGLSAFESKQRNEEEEFSNGAKRSTQHSRNLNAGINVCYISVLMTCQLCFKT